MTARTQIVTGRDRAFVPHSSHNRVVGVVDNDASSRRRLRSVVRASNGAGAGFNEVNIVTRWVAASGRPTAGDAERTVTFSTQKIN